MYNVTQENICPPYSDNEYPYISQMPWQGGVHNSGKHREKAVGASFRERIVEVAPEQWTQPHIPSDPQIWTDMPSRLQRQFHVTGTQYISTDKVQSQTLNTGGTAEDYFSPWANSPGRFLLYLDIRVKIPFDPNIIYICHIKPAAPPCIRQYTARKFICFRVHLQES